MSVCRRPAFTLLSLLQVTTEPCPNDCSATVWGEQNRHWLCRADSHLLRILPSTTEIRESSSGPTTEPALSTYLESILPLNASSANPQPGRKCWRHPIGKQQEFPADIERARDSAGNGTSLGYYMKKISVTSPVYHSAAFHWLWRSWLCLFMSLLLGVWLKKGPRILEVHYHPFGVGSRWNDFRSAPCDKWLQRGSSTTPPSVSVYIWEHLLVAPLRVESTSSGHMKAEVQRVNQAEREWREPGTALFVQLSHWP